MDRDKDGVMEDIGKVRRGRQRVMEEAILRFLKRM